MRLTTTVLLTAAAVLAGCGPQPQTTGQLLDRLSSAEKINASAPRQAALSDIANDAAVAGQPGLCLRALAGINQPQLHNETAEVAAGHFNSLGDRPTADEIVGTITNPADQDRIRTAYANHPAVARTSAY